MNLSLSGKIEAAKAEGTMQVTSRIPDNHFRMGIFGGTFDPPHIGHLILADEARYQLELDRILWVLTPFPPHKTSQQITDVSQRRVLLQAALGQNPHFELNTADLDRPAPHFAVDTLNILHAEFPEAELVYLMGGDSLDDLPNWNDPTGFLSAADKIGVMRRPGEFIDLQRLEEEIPGIARKIEFLNAPFVEISSSHIRRRVGEGGVFRYYLTAPVYQLILQMQLYQEQEEF